MLMINNTTVGIIIINCFCEHRTAGTFHDYDCPQYYHNVFLASAHTPEASMFLVRGRNSLLRPKQPAQVRGRNSPEAETASPCMRRNEIQSTGSSGSPPASAIISATPNMRSSWKHGNLQAECESLRLHHGGQELDCKKLHGQHGGLASHCATWIQALCVWRHCLLCLPYRVGRALLY